MIILFERVNIFCEGDLVVSLVANKACVLCGELGIIPHLEKMVLKADLCSCVPRPIALPKLSEEKKQKFEFWKSKQAGHGAFELMKNPKLAEISSDDELDFKGIDEVRIEILSSNKLLEERILILEKKIKNINTAHLPCEELPPGLEKLPKSVQNWVNKSSSSAPENLFLYGYNGTGKTTLGVWALYYAMLFSDFKAVFLTSDEIMGFRKDANIVGFQSRDAEVCRNRWEILKGILNKCELLIIDDIGSQKPTESLEAAYSEIIGMRYKSHLSTIYTSNHWAENGIDRKKLSDRIGFRAADRVLGAVRLFLDGPSKRQLKSVEAPIAEEYIEDEIMDPERVKNFQTTGISEGETTSPFFVAHNPVFQLVSDKERALHTNEHGEDATLPLRTYRDTWHVGDRLDVAGFLLCQNDLLCFLSLLELLHDFHRTGGRGLSFESTISAIRKKLGLKSDTSNTTKRLIRSIDRLAMTKIRYIGHNREKFIGGFVETLFHKGATSQSKLVISLNPSFIRFYEKLSFFKINSIIPANLSYQARLLYVFLESQQESLLSFPLPQLAKLYGKDEKYSKNRNFRESVRDCFKELIDAGLQDDKAKLDTNGIVLTKRIPRTSPEISLPQYSLHS